ncbi:NUDIX hydrolase [Agilicoccus flavus]|uniref:NUDIX hydrolase n=1 Tax=Agilicoccus flavus TaxID=2775968 RepID=UPI001CF6666F|nr:CoA pyrophosphatase [Agilicoccus flavus]
MTDPRPAWLGGLRAAVETHRPDWFTDFEPPPRPPRRSAVLILFGDADRPGRTGLDVVLTERAPNLRTHAAQVAFPGGHVDPEDDGPVDAALREAAEEVGLRPDTVDVVDVLPSVFLGPSGTAVTPVLAWWREPHPIGVVDPREVARVVRAPLDELLDPAHRFTVVGPRGYRGPGFAVSERRTEASSRAAVSATDNPERRTEASSRAAVSATDNPERRTEASSRAAVSATDNPERRTEASSRAAVSATENPERRTEASSRAAVSATENPDLFVWGFTAKLLDVVLDLAGIALAWDDTAERALPDHLLEAYRRDPRVRWTRD